MIETDAKMAAVSVPRGQQSQSLWKDKRAAVSVQKANRAAVSLSMKEAKRAAVPVSIKEAKKAAVSNSI